MKMATNFGYVDIPTCAIPLSVISTKPKPTYKTATTLPSAHSSAPKSSISSSSTFTSSAAPSSSPFNISSAILASGIRLPSPSPASPRSSAGQVKLLSSGTPLSLPLTTANMRRFAARVAPIFWLQDRVEEIILWKKGWKVTTAWIAMYAFLCYFPRLIFLIPHAILLSIFLTAHSARTPLPTQIIDTPVPLIQLTLAEGSQEWYANIQAIQNLMGIVSDFHDSVAPVIPHLTFSSPYTTPLLMLTIITLLLTLPMLPFLPLRPTFFILGTFPLLLTHPLSRLYLPFITKPLLIRLKAHFIKFVDDNRLDEKLWNTHLEYVDLWESERFDYTDSNGNASGGRSGSANGGGNGSAYANGSFSKSHLRKSDRHGWSQGKFGWGNTPESTKELSSEQLLTLAPGYAFVETEDWRLDYEAAWTIAGAKGHVEPDEDGWIYTDDAWSNPYGAPLEEWLVPAAGSSSSPGPGQGMPSISSIGATRSRKWVRRIYRVREEEGR